MMTNQLVSQSTPIMSKGVLLFVIIMAVASVLMAASNMLLPEGSALHVSTYTLSLFGKYLSLAILAVAVDLVWGYLGLLSLGHAAFFALGGYAMGMYLTRQIGDRGVYGDPVLPDFMVFLNWDELPWFWHGFDIFPFAMIMALLVPAILAFFVGWFAFRSRVNGVYFSIITQAMTYALLLAFFRNEMGFGGNNGLTDFKDLLGFSLQTDGMRVFLFLVSAWALVLAVLACRVIVCSRLGKVAMAVRDAESRIGFLGYHVDRIKVVIFTFSAMLAAIGGVLYVPQVGIINPSEFAPINSVEVVVWVAVGGRASLVGAVLGAVLVNYAKSWFTAVFPELWLFALGALFVLVTLFLPKGIIGLIEQLTTRKSTKNDAANAEANQVSAEVAK